MTKAANVEMPKSKSIALSSDATAARTIVKVTYPAGTTKNTANKHNSQRIEWTHTL